MMDNALNHASIFAWGWFNEGPSDQEGACPAYGACADYATSRDPSRFTTWADDKNFQGKCFAHASLISFNNYPGWYNKMGHAKYGKTFWPAQASGVRAGVTSSGSEATRGKPFVISETGAGGIYEWSQNTTDAEWTLKYQEEVILTDVAVAIENENISGITLWHLFDFKVDNCGDNWPCTKPGGGQENNTHCQYDHSPPTTFQELSKVGPPNCTYIEINGRPGGENHKGSVDFWRREKPVFAEVSKLYGGAN
jgi:beta-glucuronidase